MICTRCEHQTPNHVQICKACMNGLDAELESMHLLEEAIPALQFDLFGDHYEAHHEAFRAVANGESIRVTFVDGEVFEGEIQDVLPRILNNLKEI